MAKSKNQDLVQNKQAFHSYEILDIFEAGLVLYGTEVKSLKNHEGSLKEAYIITKENELWLINAHIPQYSHGNVYNHKEKRERKLLMHKYEIEKLKKATQEKSMTMVPIALYVSKGKVKLKFGLAKGKKLFDKRSALKEKQQKREMQRAMKEHR